MPMKLTTTIGKVQTIPNPKNRESNVVSDDGDFRFASNRLST